MINFMNTIHGCAKTYQYFLALCLTVIFVASCSQPVRRDGEKKVEALPNNMDGMPDIKKRLWIFEPKAPAVIPEGIQFQKIKNKLHGLLLNEFPKEPSPYLVQGLEDIEVFKSSGLESMADAKGISKALKGSDITGFVFSQITQIEVKVDAKTKEGLLRKKVHTLQMTFHVELHDVGGARKVAERDFIENYSETRSEVLGLTDSESIPDPDSRMIELFPALVTKVRNWAQAFAPKLAWYGRVLRVDGGRIFLSAGKTSGLLVGDVLKVLESPKDVIDPQTGIFMGLAPGRMKGTVKIVQYFGADGAIAILQSGGNISPDDRVELY